MKFFVFFFNYKELKPLLWTRKLITWALLRRTDVVLFRILETSIHFPWQLYIVAGDRILLSLLIDKKWFRPFKIKIPFKSLLSMPYYMCACMCIIFYFIYCDLFYCFIIRYIKWKKKEFELIFFIDFISFIDFARDL